MIEEVIKIAEETGRTILTLYQRELEVELKSDNTPISEADRSSHRLIIKGLAKFDLPILSEEGKSMIAPDKNKKLWVIDPLDGTMDFLQKTGDFSVMIALLEKGKPILGVIYAPVYSKLYFAEKGKGAFLKEDGKIRRLKVSSQEKIERATMLVSRNHFSELMKKFAGNFNLAKVIKMGSLGVKAGHIAEGKSDLTFNEHGLSVWDIAAPTILIEETGGQASFLDGSPVIINTSLSRSPGFIISNGHLHQQIVRGIKNLIA